MKLRCLHPAAFAINMGTGTLACVTLKQAAIFPSLELAGKILCLFNYGLFAILAVYAAMSWSVSRDEIRERLRVPGHAAFFATLGIALLVLANQSMLYGFGWRAAFSFWLAGAIVTFLINFALIGRSFLRENELEFITPAFFLPVVSLAVISFAGFPLSAGLAAPWREAARLLCVLGLGAGAMLYFGLFGAMLQRHLLLKPLPDHLAPTLWIHLAPLGWGALGVLAFAESRGDPAALAAVEFLALLAWGAAAWWTVMAGIFTLRAAAGGGMAFSMAWWSFIFPLGSFALLTLRSGVGFGAEISFCVWLLMACLWLLSAIKTLGLAFWPK